MVLFIIGVMAVIALPSYRQLLDRSEEDIARAELLRLITLAQKTAIAKHAQVYICKSSDLLHCHGTGRDGELIVVNATKNSDGDIKDQDIVYAQSARGILRWQSYPRYRDDIMFMPTGLLGSDNSTFWFCLHEQGYPAFAIFLSKSGRARLVYPDSDGRIKDSKKRVLSCDVG